MKRALICVVLMLAACEGLKTSQFAGPPLGTLDGSVIAPQPIEGSYRLAIVWQSATMVSLTGPVGSETQAIEEEASTLLYSFAIHKLPPKDAMVPRGNSGGHIARGAVLAFQDLNGNGELDLIPLHGRPIDRVLTPAAGHPPASEGYMVVFADQEGLSDYSGVLLQRGFNIIRFSGNSLEATRVDSLPLVLRRSRWNNASLCADVDDFSCYCEAEDDLFVHGTIYMQGGEASARLLVGDCNGKTKDASVILNGQPLEYGPLFEATVPGEIVACGGTWCGQDGFRLIEQTPSVIKTGMNELRVTLPGHREVALQVPAGAVQLLSPLDGSTYPAGQPIDVAWQAPSDLTERMLLFAPYGDSPGIFRFVTGATHWMVPGDRVVAGTTEVDIDTWVDVWTDEGSSVTSDSMAFALITISP